ncbi:hypothetical protein L9F63_016066, partial [Diploptera punctata]
FRRVPERRSFHNIMYEKLVSLCNKAMLCNVIHVPIKNSDYTLTSKHRSLRERQKSQPMKPR